MFSFLYLLLAILVLVPVRVHALFNWDDIAKYIKVNVDQSNELVPLMIGSVFVLFLIFMVFGVMSKYLLSSLNFAMLPSPADMKQGP